MLCLEWHAWTSLACSTHAVCHHTAHLIQLCNKHVKRNKDIFKVTMHSCVPWTPQAIVQIFDYWPTFRGRQVERCGSGPSSHRGVPVVVDVLCYSIFFSFLSCDSQRMRGLHVDFVPPDRKVEWGSNIITGGGHGSRAPHRLLDYSGSYERGIGELSLPTSVRGVPFTCAWRILLPGVHGESTTASLLERSEKN